MKKIKQLLSILLIMMTLLSSTGLAVSGVESDRPIHADIASNPTFRLRLTDEFGIMVIAGNVDGFVFTTDSYADWNTLARVEGQAYNDTERLYSIYDDLTATTLDTTVYLAAYKEIDGVLYWSRTMTINPYKTAVDMQDGIYGNTEDSPGLDLSIDETEKKLYGSMCYYCEAWKDYEMPDWRKIVTINGVPMSEWVIGVPSYEGTEALLAEELVKFFSGKTGKRISIITPEKRKGTEKNIIVIGAKGRDMIVPDYFDGEYYVAKNDSQGMVVSLLSSKSGGLQALVTEFKNDVSKVSDASSIAFTISEKDDVHFSIEDEMTKPWRLVSETKTALHDGVTYIEQTFVDPSGAPYRTYALLLDPDKVNLHMGTANDSFDRTVDTETRQTTKQHMQVAVASGEHIVAAVNGNFFNGKEDGAPRGLVIKDGVLISESDADYPFIAFTEDGEIIVDEGDTFNQYVREGKKFTLGYASWAIILNDGLLTSDAMNPDGAHHPRTLMGYAEDGTIILGVIDGRQATFSNGASFMHCALWMRSLGATVAVNMDGGGSSNMILRDPETDTYDIRNSPSDGSLRKVYNSILVELKTP